MRVKSILVSLGSLVLESLVEGAYPAIENSCHPWHARWASVRLVMRPQRHPLRLRSRLPSDFACPLTYAFAGIKCDCNADFWVEMCYFKCVSLTRLSALALYRFMVCR